MSRGKTWNNRWYKADMFNMKYCQARHTTNGTKIVVLHSPNAKRGVLALGFDYMQKKKNITWQFKIDEKEAKKARKEIRIVSAEKKHNKLLCWT